MRIIRTFAFWLAAIVAVGLLYLLVADPRYSVVIRQADVQQALNDKLPFTSPPKGMMVFTVRQGADVAFGADGRIHVNGRFEAKPTFTNSSHYEGTLKASGELEFRHGAFYIAAPKVENLDGQLVLSDRAKAVTGILGRLKDKAKEVAGVTPEEQQKLYNPESMKARALDWMVAKFATVPVYKLDGKKWWHSLANTAMDTVEVADQTVTVTLSLSKLALSIILGIALVVATVAITFGIFMSGGEGLGALLFLGLFSS